MSVHPRRPEGRTVFLDVDGTLVPHSGLVPESAQDAVRTARANGHRVFLCTGRSPSQLWPDLLAIGFDGVVAAAGAYVRAGDEVLVRHQMSAADLRRIKGFFDPRGIDYYLEGEDGVFATRQLQARLRDLIFGPITDADARAVLRRGPFAFLDAIEVDADPVDARLAKLVFLDSPLPLEAIREEFGDRFDVVPTSVTVLGGQSGEMMLRGVHKAAGIEALLRHLDIDRAATIALGDSHNDIEMLAHVAVGIAMGNAPQAVRDVADEVTASPDEHGVRLAFLRHGLIH